MPDPGVEPPIRSRARADYPTLARIERWWRDDRGTAPQAALELTALFDEVELLRADSTMHDPQEAV